MYFFSGRLKNVLRFLFFMLQSLQEKESTNNLVFLQCKKKIYRCIYLQVYLKVKCSIYLVVQPAPLYSLNIKVPYTIGPTSLFLVFCIYSFTERKGRIRKAGKTQTGTRRIKKTERRRKKVYMFIFPSRLH